jgi:hypothetical protein
MLLNLLIAEKSGFHAADGAEQAELKQVADRMTREALTTMEQTGREQSAATNGTPVA